MSTLHNNQSSCWISYTEVFSDQLHSRHPVNYYTSKIIYQKGVIASYLCQTTASCKKGAAGAKNSAQGERSCEIQGGCQDWPKNIHCIDFDGRLMTKILMLTIRQTFSPRSWNEAARIPLNCCYYKNLL